MFSLTVSWGHCDQAVKMLEIGWTASL